MKRLTTRRKYGNIPTVVDGITFHSKAEANRWLGLKLMERGGVVKKLKRQPRFPFYVNGCAIGSYIGDFAYIEGGRDVCEDVKGFETKEFVLKWKLVQALYPWIDFRLYPPKPARRPA